MSKRTLYEWLLTLPLLAAGCVGEDVTDCPPPEQPSKKMVMLRVYDHATQEPITDLTRIKDATFFVFDQNKELLMEANVPGIWLNEPVPILPEDYTGDRVYVSTWANIAVDGWIEPLDYNLGDSLGASFLTLPNLVRGDGYLNFPGEQFFGFQEIPLVDGPDGPPVQKDDIVYVDISQVNARLDITVRGLPQGASADDYYFELRNQNIGYNFNGDPVPDSAMIRESGIFNQAGELVSAEPYYLVHMTDPTKVDRDNVMWLHFFQKAPATRAEGDTDLTGAIYHDQSGNYLTLAQGMTSHVLIDFQQNGKFTVQIVILPWDKIHYWTIEEKEG